MGHCAETSRSQHEVRDTPRVLVEWRERKSGKFSSAYQGKVYSLRSSMWASGCGFMQEQQRTAKDSGIYQLLRAS